MRDSGRRLFDMAIVWKLDRSAWYKTTLEKNGVKVVSASEVISDRAEGYHLGERVRGVR